jgi:N-acetylmuramic acid 6-phosphate etherase
MLNDLTTEASNPGSREIDALSAEQIVQLMNQEDTLVAAAVASQAGVIAQSIDVIANRISAGGRLIYLGAGTSGRLGVLDASECPPTFNTPPEMVVGLIAGGYQALTRSIEGAEDHPETAHHDLEQVRLSDADVLVGIATSGRTPYVIAGLEYGRQVGASTIGLTCNENSELAALPDLLIAPVVGPEVITGSTRLKAGTATKMVLNMLTTGAMVRIGKTFGNLMVDLRASNIKLTDRSRRILIQLTDLDSSAAERLLGKCDGELKTAIVSHLRSTTPQNARQLLAEADGHLRQALEKDKHE